MPTLEHDQKPIRIVKGHTDSVTTVSFSPNGKWVATGAMDKRILIWDSANGRLHKELKGHEQMVLAVAFGPNGKMLGSADGNIIDPTNHSQARLWHVLTDN
jgi:WD40 repeat protein